MIAIIFLVGLFIGGCADTLISQSNRIDRQQKEIDRLREQQNNEYY